MSETLAIDTYGMLTEPATLKIQRRLPGPVERVWRYLTDSDLRRKWLASGDMQLSEGAGFELVWRNDELTDPPGERPDGFSVEHSMASRITEIHAPYKLSFTWGENGEVTFDLEEAGQDVVLTVTHKRIRDRGMMLMVGAGWHMHLDVLVGQLEGPKPAPFWDGWLRLKADYDQRLPK